MTPVIYIIAICLANYSVYFFGPVSMPFNAFLLIGLDLALRDQIHDRYGFVATACLSLAASLLSFLINPAAASIAVAGSVAFFCASLADGSIYQAMRGRGYMLRTNTSNTAGALADSVIFPTLAFGVLMPEIIAAQFIAKSFGGFVWSIILKKSEAV